MLEIFNNMKPFFMDCYRKINVREYARIANISPPSSSKLLKELYKEGLLNKEEEKNYIYYLANKESKIFVELSRLYWFQELKKSGLIDYFEKEFISPLIILYGSLSKAEVTQKSDVDLVIFSITKKELNLDKFEEKLKRKIQLFTFRSKNDIKNKELLNNILNGFIISGDWF